MQISWPHGSHARFVLLSKRLEHEPNGRPKPRGLRRGGTTGQAVQQPSPPPAAGAGRVARHHCGADSLASHWPARSKKGAAPRAARVSGGGVGWAGGAGGEQNTSDSRHSAVCGQTVDGKESRRARPVPAFPFRSKLAITSASFGRIANMRRHIDPCSTY